MLTYFCLFSQVQISQWQYHLILATLNENIGRLAATSGSSSSSPSPLRYNVDLILPRFSLSVLKSQGNNPQVDALISVEGTELKFLLESNPNVPNGPIPDLQLKMSLGRLIVDDVSLSCSVYHDQRTILHEYRRLCSIFPAPALDQQSLSGFNMSISQFSSAKTNSKPVRSAACQFGGCDQVATFACPRCEALSWPVFLTCSQAHFDILWQQFHAAEHEHKEPPKHSTISIVPNSTQAYDVNDVCIQIGVIDVNLLPFFGLLQEELPSFLTAPPNLSTKYAIVASSEDPVSSMGNDKVLHYVCFTNFFVQKSALKLAASLKSASVHMFSDPCSPSCESVSLIVTSNAQLQILPQTVISEGHVFCFNILLFLRRSRLFTSFSVRKHIVFDSQTQLSCSTC